MDLGKDFYSIRFSLKEDMDAMLKNGSWFFGGHFLSIRPWELFFKPASASVSSIAVWLWLHELPMELYELEVLKQVGEAIGKVLRIDSYTAMEARGRYARLCIQLDVTRPLIDTVLIGRFEQPMVYEGIHRLCFSCERLGHRKESCPFTIKKPKPPVKGGPMSAEEGRASYQGEVPHGLHDSSCTDTSSGTMKDRGGTKEDRYGPWMLVTRRKPGQKKTNLGVMFGDHPLHRLGQASHGFRKEQKDDTRDWAFFDKGAENVGPLRVGREPNFGVKMLDKQVEFHFSPSIKGKRDLARSKATKWLTKGDTGGVGKHLPNTTATWGPRGRNGDSEYSGESFQFSTGGRIEMDKQARRLDRVFGVGYGGDQSEANGCDAMDQSEVNVRNGGQHKTGFTTTCRSKSSNDQEQPSHGEGDDVWSDGLPVGSVSGERKDNEVVGTDGMEMEEGSRDFASSI